MLAGISSRQWRQWRAYYLLEPFGPREEDYRLAQVCAMMRNLWAGGERRSPADYMHQPALDPPAEDQPQSGLEMHSILQADFERRNHGND